MSAAMLDIGAAVCAVHIGQRLIRPPAIKSEHTLLRFLLASMPGGDVHQIDGQDIGDEDFRGMTAALSVGLVLTGKVLAESALGARAILCRAARADFAWSVSDDPHGALS